MLSIPAVARWDEAAKSNGGVGSAVKQSRVQTMGEQQSGIMINSDMIKFLKNLKCAVIIINLKGSSNKKSIV